MQDALVRMALRRLTKTKHSSSDEFNHSYIHFTLGVSILPPQPLYRFVKPVVPTKNSQKRLFQWDSKVRLDTDFVSINLFFPSNS